MPMNAAQIRRQLRRKPRRLPPPPGWDENAEERDNARIKADAENRMRVFDQAPRRIRQRANAEGEHVIRQWWDDLWGH